MMRLDGRRLNRLEHPAKSRSASITDVHLPMVVIVFLGRPLIVDMAHPFVCFGADVSSRLSIRVSFLFILRSVK